MDITEDQSRLYAGMTADQITAHEDWVRRFKAERADEEARLIEAVRARFADLMARVKPMTDLQVIEALFEEAIEPHWDSYSTDAKKALQVLRAAGFVRLSTSAGESLREINEGVTSRETVIAEEGASWQIVLARQNFEKAYLEATQTSLADDWMQAALLGQQLVNALDGRP